MGAGQHPLALEGIAPRAQARLSTATGSLISSPFHCLQIQRQTTGSSSALELRRPAGRLTHDIVGSVFLLNYDEWKTKPMGQFVPFRVKPAIAETLVNDGTVVAQALRDGAPPAEQISKPETFRIRTRPG